MNSKKIQTISQRLWAQEQDGPGDPCRPQNSLMTPEILLTKICPEKLKNLISIGTYFFKAKVKRKFNFFPKLTLLSKAPCESKVCKFCSIKANPAAYNVGSSSCSTDSATQNNALWIGDSFGKREKYKNIQFLLRQRIPTNY